MSVNLEEQYNKIYKYCYFKLRNRDLAEDITQETFLKYFKKQSYITRKKELAYLYIIAKNLCIDYYKKIKPIELSEELIACDKITKAENSITIRESINKLSEEEREIIFLRFTNDLGINEIAKVLEISRYVVYRKLNKSLKELKNHLREEEFYE